jgi:hypothetical protein
MTKIHGLKQFMFMVCIHFCIRVIYLFILIRILNRNILQNNIVIVILNQNVL